MPHYDLTDRPMYDAERYTRATVAESPSLLYNNLTAGPSSLGYVHGSQAIVVPVERALSGDPSEKRPILTEGGNRTAYQVKAVTLGAETFFVLCTAESVHVFDDSGRTLRHARPLPGAAAVALPDGTEMANFARGVCSSCSEDGRAQLCVGTANGSVLVMEYDGARFRDAACLDGHYQVPIADLGSEVDSFRGSAPPDSAGPRAVIASADDAGVVVAWRAITSDRFETMFWLQLESPVVAVAARGDQIVAAATSGRVSFISLRTQKVYCELQAHSRYLSALDMHPTQDVFATVAEDSTLAVYEPPVPNSGLPGGPFLQRRATKKPGSNVYLRARDMRVGAVIEVSGRLMRLNAADDATFLIMERRPAEFPLSDAAAVAAKLRRSVEALGKPAADELRRRAAIEDVKLGGGGAMALDRGSFLEVMCGVPGLDDDAGADPQSLMTLWRSLDKHGFDPKATRTPAAVERTAVDAEYVKIEHLFRVLGVEF